MTLKQQYFIGGMNEWHQPENAKRLRSQIVMKRATEEQAQSVASFLNQLIPQHTRSGWRYKVLDVYPHCNTKRVVFIHAS